MQLIEKIFWVNYFLYIHLCISIVLQKLSRCKIGTSYIPHTAEWLLCKCSGLRVMLLGCNAQVTNSGQRWCPIQNYTSSDSPGIVDKQDYTSPHDNKLLTNKTAATSLEIILLDEYYVYYVLAVTHTVQLTMHNCISIVTQITQTVCIYIISITRITLTVCIYQLLLYLNTSGINVIRQRILKTLFFTYNIYHFRIQLPTI